MPLILSGLMLTAIQATAQEVGLFLWYDTYDWKADDGNIENARLVRQPDGTWQSDVPLTRKNNNRVRITVYAPYDEQASITNYSFSMPEDQSCDEALRKADLQTYSEWYDFDRPDDKLQLQHWFSKVVVKVVPGNGILESDLLNGTLKVRLNNFQTQTEIDFSRRSYSTPSSPTTIIPHKLDELTYEAIFVPWFKTSIVSVIWNNMEYNYDCILMRSNRQYNITVTIGKKNQGGIDIGIDDWENSGEDYGGTVN